MAYRQIGVTALRAPSGEFLEAVPIYAEVSVAGDGATDAERSAADQAARVTADKIRQYKDGCRAAEKEGT